MEVIPKTPEGIEKAAAYIRAGKLVVWPSPVWYGLCTNALDPVAIKRVYAAKRRAPTEALLVLAIDKADAERYGEINPIARKLVDAYWPGFLGVIVRKKPGVIPDFVTSGKDTVLLACLDDLGYELPVKAGVPVVSSSANVSGTPPALDMDDVRSFAERAGDKIDAVIEGPLSPINMATTIVDTLASPPTIIRTGVVHENSIRKLLPDVVVRSAK
ncbi:MAG TPA: L-threonylcarbamoyladenylate synthase [Micromonosporaceae bacterium]